MADVKKDAVYQRDVPFKDYVDNQLSEVRRAVEVALDAAAREGVDVKEYFEAILDEQRRGMVVAEEEREKSAVALRAELTRQIEQGDRALGDHIRTQIEQIKLLAMSLDDQARLRIDGVADSVQRVEKAAEQHVAQLRREREMVTAAQQEAIAKAEMANEKRFEAVNEFRANLADQTASFMPREVAESKFSELQKQVNVNTDRLNQTLGEKAGSVSTVNWVVAAASFMVAVVAVLANVLTG